MNAQRNIAASVRARLTARAKERNENVQLNLLRYAIERLLYRLSRSQYANDYVLKGAMLLNVWAETPYRASDDLDLLGYGNNSPEMLVNIFREVSQMEVAPDGVEFLQDTVRAERTQIIDEYHGIRVKLGAKIASAHLTVQIDIGFGDIITPEAEPIAYPTLLEFPVPQLRAYPRETVVAEKFQAMVQFGALTTRMKDFYDLWAISSTFDFHGPILAKAIQATFMQRKTDLPTDTPEPLEPTFAADSTKAAQWQGFLKRTAIELAPSSFAEVLETNRLFVMPPTIAAANNLPFDLHWSAGGLWKER